MKIFIFQDKHGHTIFHLAMSPATYGSVKFPTSLLTLCNIIYLNIFIYVTYVSICIHVYVHMYYINFICRNDPFNILNLKIEKTYCW